MKKIAIIALQFLIFLLLIFQIESALAIAPPQSNSCEIVGKVEGISIDSENHTIYEIKVIKILDQEGSHIKEGGIYKSRWHNYSGDSCKEGDYVSSDLEILSNDIIRIIDINRISFWTMLNKVYHANLVVFSFLILLIILTLYVLFLRKPIKKKWSDYRKRSS